MLVECQKHQVPPLQICTTMLTGIALVTNAIVSKKKVWKRLTWVETSIRAKWGGGWGEGSLSSMGLPI